MPLSNKEEVSQALDLIINEAEKIYLQSLDNHGTLYGTDVQNGHYLRSACNSQNKEAVKKVCIAVSEDEIEVGEMLQSKIKFDKLNDLFINSASKNLVRLIFETEKHNEWVEMRLKQEQDNKLAAKKQLENMNLNEEQVKVLARLNLGRFINGYE